MAYRYSSSPVLTDRRAAGDHESGAKHPPSRFTASAASSTDSQLSVSRYSLIEAAALRPAAMARITVAALVTMSPPAKPLFDVQKFPDRRQCILRGLEVRRGRPDQWVSLSAQGDHGHLDRDLNSEPGTATGDRRPEASGSPSSILMHRTASENPFLSPRNATGLVRQRNSIPSLAWRAWPPRAGRASRSRIGVDQVRPLAPRRQAVRTTSMAVLRAAHHGNFLTPAVEHRLVKDGKSLRASGSRVRNSFAEMGAVQCSPGMPHELRKARSVATSTASYPSSFASSICDRLPITTFV